IPSLWNLAQEPKVVRTTNIFVQTTDIFVRTTLVFPTGNWPRAIFLRSNDSQVRSNDFS
ncbi:hypothetical protein GIB67_024377, partial [Kingdonia uniflora]